MELIKFTLHVSKDTVTNFWGTLPNDFNSRFQLWEHIKKCPEIDEIDIEDLYQLNWSISYDGSTLSILESQPLPIQKEFGLKFN